MLFGDKFVSSQQKCHNNFKPIVSNIITIVEYYLMDFLTFNEPCLILVISSKI